MKIYIAGKFEERRSLWPVRARMQHAGHECLSTWLDEPDWTGGPGPVGSEAAARIDLEAIRACDLFIQDTAHRSARAGAMVEFGYALALGKPCWVVGERVNLFHRLAARQYAAWHFALRALAHLDDSSPSAQSQSLLPHSGQVMVLGD